MEGSKYFLIKTRDNYALTLSSGYGSEEEYGSPMENMSVDIKPINSWKSDYQAWFFDPLSRKIMSRRNKELCLSNCGDSITMDVKENSKLKWSITDHADSEDCITTDTGRVLIVEERSAKKKVLLSNDTWSSQKQQFILFYEPRKYFYIVSKMHNKVLDIELKRKTAEARIVLFQQKTSVFDQVDNQLWYEDKKGYIRSKLNDFSMHNDESYNVMRTVNCSTEHDQDHWCINKDTINNAANKAQVAEVRLRCKDNSTPLIATTTLTDEPFQHWIFRTQFFYIKSKLHGKVLDVKRKDASPGATVSIWQQKSGWFNYRDNQLWYEDRDGYIHSRMNHFVLTTDKNGELTLNKMRQENLNQHWCIRQDQIVNCSQGTVAGIKDGNRDNHAVVHAEVNSGQDSQRWETQMV